MYKTPEISKEETDKIKSILDKLEEDALEFLKSKNVYDTFAIAEVFHYDTNVIFVKLKFGTKEDTHTELYSINRKTWEVKD
jgi:hypothetical protein